jgi:hypothetical protein
MSATLKTGTGRPREGYKNALGEKIPGTTTIIGRFKESGALIYWAWTVGKEGKDLRDEQSKAADAGSCCHEMIDCHLHGRNFQMAPWENLAIAKAEHAFMGYLDWTKQNKLKVEASEVSLISERYQFGGTFDAVVRAGELYLLDYKTSNGIYTDMIVQVAGAYSLLWQENFPSMTLHGMDLLRVSKPKLPDDPVSFTHHHWSGEIFPIAQEQFLHMRRAYDLDKRLKSFL